MNKFTELIKNPPFLLLIFFVLFAIPIFICRIFKSHIDNVLEVFYEK